MAFVDIENISKIFPDASGKGSFCVFQDVSFGIEQSEFVTMVGHSGCGKSTILNIIAGLEEPTTGGVCLGGKQIDGAGLDRMVVFQSFALIPWMSAFDNVKMAVKSAHRDWDKEQIRAHTEKSLATMGLAGSGDKKPSQLSGGMRQRVGLARAFAVGPKMLLLDEPFAQIDALTRGVIQDELVQMWQDTRNTVFMVTHDVDEAILLSDKIVLMTNGPRARIAEIVEIPIPRPRKRETIIDHPLYYRIRNHLLHFLIERSSALQRDDAESDGAHPATIRWDEALVEPALTATIAGSGLDATDGLMAVK